MHVGPTTPHRLREEIARELFSDTDDTSGRERPHDERARARTGASTTPGDEGRRDDPGEDATTEPDDDRPLAERATDSVFESEPATDVEILTGDAGE